MRLAVLLLSGGILLAQETTFRTTVPVVIAPATVTDAKGRYIDGLSAGDFTVLDDDKPRRFQLDTSDTLLTPMTVVVAIQANSTAPAAILRIRKIGSMIEPLVTGERGSAAVLAFGHEIKLVQDFTNDADKLTRAFRGIKTQSGRAAVMIDAVAEAVRMFDARPANERRVIFVISESKDRGSKAKLEEVVRKVEANGVAVYPIVFSAYSSPWITKASDLPPSEGGMDLIAAIQELARLGKADASQLLSNYSGGRRVWFGTQRGLEGIVTSLGEELHSQYIFGYTPVECSPGLHKIQVRVKGRPEAVVRARYGYWTDEQACKTSAP